MRLGRWLVGGGWCEVAGVRRVTILLLYLQLSDKAKKKQDRWAWLMWVWLVWDIVGSVGGYNLWRS